jgi:pyruvate kinase
MTRRAKIVCTLGPATATRDGIRRLVDAGMDVARLNLSHGSYDGHAETYEWVRAASDETGRAVGVLVDLQGPKIRLGLVAGGPVMLRTGDRFVITTDQVPGDARCVSTTYAGLPSDVHAGDTVLVDDGRVVLHVVGVSSCDVDCQVVVGGQVSSHKGLNLPGVPVRVPALTDKDEADLRWALRLGADLLALSFVRGPADVEPVRRVMAEEGASLPVLAKIEKPQAVDRLDEVLDAFDGVMVARGDLGVELPLEDVPLVQKRVVEAARLRAKPVIVATQMLESMISAPRPTRAEASDVANAVLDGADALMLSGETSVGAYPYDAVTTMARIIERVEAGAPPLPAHRTRDEGSTTVGGAITRAAAMTGAALEAQALVGFTQTGDTARRLARQRSPIPLLAFTPVQAVRSQLALTWGVETFLVPMVETTDEMVAQVDQALLAVGRLREGDLAIVAFGHPPGAAGHTDTMLVHRVGRLAD